MPSKYIITATDDTITLVERSNVHNGFLDKTLGTDFSRVSDALQEIAYEADNVWQNHYHIEVIDNRTS
jgi:hypothetical protein